MTVANSLVVKTIRARREALLGIIITIIMNVSTICNKQQVEGNKWVAAPSSVAAATTSRWSEHGAVVGARVYCDIC